MDDLVKEVSAVKLSDATLGALPDEIARPRYDRRSLTPGIVHVGLGNFHRAHQAWYIHRLMQQGLAQDWAVIGAGVRPYDARMRQTLLAQDCMTTLIELDHSGTSAEVTGPMVDYVPVEEGCRALVSAMAEPSIRIVSLTVTEGGYFIDPASGAFDAGHPDIRHDAVLPGRPVTAFGAMIAALRIRRDAGHGPFTLLSCDNLNGNGAVLRKTTVSLAQLSDPDLAAWIDRECSFPISMVDCIVPATGPNELALSRRLGIEDAAPVTHESFRQWVIEDDFCAGRPDWDRVGATFSNRVHDFETMKIRILNAGHQILANAGELLSFATIADCMADPVIRAFFRRVQREEIAPHVAAVPGMSPEAYAKLIERRFANAAIQDTTRRVAFDGSSRHSSFVLPILRDGLSAGAPVDGLSLAEALWARMCAGTRENGSEIEANDPRWEDLSRVAEAARTRPQAWLEQRHIYGDLVDNDAFASSFGAWLTMVWLRGSRAALQHYVSG